MENKIKCTFLANRDELPNNEQLPYFRTSIADIMKSCFVKLKVEIPSCRCELFLNNEPTEEEKENLNAYAENGVRYFVWKDENLGYVEIIP